MRFSKFRLFIGLVIFIAPYIPVSVAIAQTTEPDLSSSDTIRNTPITGTSSDLRISPRAGFGHTTSGGGIDGTTQFRGFIPLHQEPGRNITFFIPQLLLDNEGQLGSNLLFGHRAYSQNSNRIWGGYLSLDHRDTDDSEFYQLGLGLETLGEILDARINGYIPLGDTSQTIYDRTFDTGLELSSGFEGNLLLLSRRQERQRVHIEDIALTGFDAEVGVRLATWDENKGELRGFAGLYFYDAVDINSSLGWRLGLEIRPIQNLILGVTVQEDDLFGSHVIGSVSLALPRVRPKGPVPEELEVAARLGELVRRNSSITIETQETRESIIEETIDPLMNPEEDDPYRFIHVTLGRTDEGDGTFENPFATVQEAIDDSISDGNNIVYVDAGTNPNIPAFTIPDRVTVLSQGPEQVLAGLPFPGFAEDPSRLPFSPVINFDEGILVRLPFSGDGNFPTIQDAGATNLVTMGNRTVLSGFLLPDAPENAIIANSVHDIEIRDTIISNPGERGIYLNDVTGSSILFSNSISGAQTGTTFGQGLLILNTVSGALETFIYNQQLDSNRIGIEISATGDIATLEDPSQTITINNTTITNNTNEGLIATANSLGNQIIAFRNGEISSNGSDGIRVEAFNSSSQEFTFENSSLTNNAGHGIRVQAGSTNSENTAAQESFIRANQIRNNGGDGISIEANEVTAQEFAITDNIITNNEGAGIRAVANNVSFQEYVTDTDNNSFGVSGNTITNNGDVGLELLANDSSTLVADIINNDIKNNETEGAPETTITANTNTVDVCTVLNGNSSTTGIQLNNNRESSVSAFFQVGDLTTLSTRNIGGITLFPETSTFTDLGGVSSCF